MINKRALPPRPPLRRLLESILVVLATISSMTIPPSLLAEAYSVPGPPPAAGFQPCQDCRCTSTQKLTCTRILGLGMRRTATAAPPQQPPPSSIFPTLASISVNQAYLQQQQQQQGLAGPEEEETRQLVQEVAGDEAIGEPGDLSQTGGMLLAGQWDITSSNDVRLSSPMKVEINVDQSMRLVTHSHRWGMGYQVSIDADFHLNSGKGQEAEGLVYFDKANRALESIMGVGMPYLHEPRRHGGNGERRVDKERIRVLLEDLDTLMVLLADRKTFYLLKRSLSMRKAKPSYYESGATTISLLIATNIVAWISTKVLEAMGAEYSWMSFQFPLVAHHVLQLLHHAA